MYRAANLSRVVAGRGYAEQNAVDLILSFLY